MPDVTKTDVLAIIQAVVALLVSFGLDLTDVQTASIISLSAVIAGVLPLADAKRRNGRVELAIQQMHLEARNGPTALDGYTGPKFG